MATRSSWSVMVSLRPRDWRVLLGLGPPAGTPGLWLAAWDAEPPIRYEAAAEGAGAHWEAGGESSARDATYFRMLAATSSASRATYFVLFLFLFLFFIDFFKDVFWAFRNKGSSKTRKKHFRKIPSGLITKNTVFFSPFFFSPSVVLFDFFYHVFGRFVTRGVQKRKGRQKTKNEKTTYICASSQKKVRTYLLYFFIFF
jgi:hypothetical protein